MLKGSVCDCAQNPYLLLYASKNRTVIQKVRKIVVNAEFYIKTVIFLLKISHYIQKIEKI